MTDNWDFSHKKAAEAVWTDGLREIFEYCDLGIKGATKGDYIAHIIKANGKEMKDEVQEWHVHDCTFQFVLVLNGWAEFEGTIIMEAADFLQINAQNANDINYVVYGMELT